jgi:hypothetical protein
MYMVPNAELIAYSRTPINTYMLLHMRSAGVNAIGSPLFIFGDEERSYWTEPDDCE